VKVVGRVVLMAIAATSLALAPAAAQAASISGTVSAETTHVGIAGVQVCPTPRPYEFEVDCVDTDPTGHYSVDGLPSAQYVLRFSAFRENLRYVDEYYDNKAVFNDADLVALDSPDDSQQIDVELAEGGSITGTLIDEETKEPIEGVAACAWIVAGEYQRCDTSDAVGFYEINGLPSDEYVVEYEGWNRVNYVRELYDDASDLGLAADVFVVAPETTSGIDAELARGAEILGHVSEAETGAPVEGSMVCAPLASASYADSNTNCEWTDAAGNYAIRGLPAGTYVVGFDVGFLPFTGLYVEQWSKDATLRSEATPLELTTPQTVVGIDGRVNRPVWAPPSEGEPSSPPPAATSSVQLLPSAKPPVKCRKGFHRKLVKGKKKCVRKPRHRPSRQRHQR
jgi:hypothetical protein